MGGGLSQHEKEELENDYAKCVGHDESPLKTPVYRHPQAPSTSQLKAREVEELVSPFQQFERQAKLLRNKPCLGTKVRRGDAWDYEWKSYGQVLKDAEGLATSILDLQLAKEVTDPEHNLKLSTIGICSINREEWLVTDLAANLINVTTVPLYETLGNEMLMMILN